MSTPLAAIAANKSLLTDIAPDELPHLIGEAEALRAMLWAKLQAPAAPMPPERPEAALDRLLTAEEAAERLGVSKRWVYTHADSLPFTRRLSGGTLRFSERGLQRWQESRR